MDRHDVSEAVTAEIVADLHQKDLKIQDQFNCKGLTYWFDDVRKTAFCLVEAPDKAAIQKMHDHAHGVVAHRIIEVDGTVVESFLGRIEDPQKSQNNRLNIINDPAFRIIMVVELTSRSLFSQHDEGVEIIEKLQQDLVKHTSTYMGRMVQQKNNYYLLSFDSVTKAVLCALRMQSEFQEKFKSYENVSLQLGLSAGIPVSEKEGIFEDTIQTAERLCRYVNDCIVITSEVGDLYESENLNRPLDNKLLTKLQQDEEKFLNLLMDVMDKEWRNSSLSISKLSQSSGFSKSQFYRKITALTGMSPNSFIRAFRLQKALNLLSKNNENISEVAYHCGFNSPAYFSKCFQVCFGMLPSAYLNLDHPKIG